MSANPLDYIRTDTRKGASFLIGSDSPDLISQLRQAANGAQTETATPEGGEDDEAGGPITRFTDEFSPLSVGLLEHLGLNGHEIANDIQTRVAELYRNDFPVLEAAFERKCTECETEYDERVDECSSCGADGEALREPDPAEKRELMRRMQRVNKEGQSLRELAQSLEWDQWLTGVPILVIQHKYAISPNGTVVPVAVSDLVKGDPKRIVPVVDEHRRIGGYWWACARCRHAENYEPVGRGELDEVDEQCPSCGAELREVYYAEKGDGSGSSTGKTEIDAYYFEEEILTFPWPFPRLHGLDGLSPIHHIWLKQLIIDFQDRYAGAFYDPESDRLPNQFIVLHTTNPDAWEERLNAARESSKEDVYDSPVFTNEYSPSDSSTPEVQVVDAMPDELLGQNQEIRETYKKDIRRATNISDVHDNETSDAGGLNNEGLQIEVVDRPTATQMHDYETGWLMELAIRLGVEDWRFGYIDATGPDAEDLRAEVEAGKLAEESGLDARMVDDRVEIADGPFDVPEPAAEPGGFGGGLPMAEESGDNSSHDYGPDDPLQRAGRDQLDDACDTLFRAHQHLIWPNVTEQRAAEPFWDRDESMPEFVEAMIREALRGGAIREISEKLPTGTTRADVRTFFQDQLSQPAGWSLRSLTENYADRFGVSTDEAVTAVRTQTTSVLNEAREEGYRRQGDLEERAFKHIGPDDDDNTDTCIAIRARTNPEYGGEPVTLDEYKRILAEERAGDFPTFRGPDTIAHFNCRHTYVEHFD